MDDTDPEVFRTGFVDADGDGFMAENSETCVGLDVPEDIIFVMRGYDCDDSDAGVHLWFVPDQDGDGYPNLTDEEAFLCTDESPDGYVLLGFNGDCDDDDPTRYPAAAEQFEDGIDSDCDGEDDPAVRSEELEAQLAGPTASNCPDAELSVLAAPGCSVCLGQSGPVYIRVANTGERASEPVELDIEIERDVEHVAIGALQPGEMTRVFTIVSKYMVSASLNLSDCDESNNQTNGIRAQTSCTR